MNISGNLDRAKDYAKSRLKREATKLLMKLGKKVLMAAAKAAKALLIKLVIGLGAILGFKGLLIILIIIIVGGSIMFIFPSFGWFSSDSGSPKTPEELQAVYQKYVIESSAIEEYRPPQLLVQFVDNIRMLKESDEPWEIDPKRVTSELKVDITMETFTNEYTTKTVKLVSKEIENDEVTEGTTDPIEYEPEENESSTSEKIKLVTKAHTWDRIETISYKQDSTSHSYSYTDTNGNEVFVTEEANVWIVDQKSTVRDFSKFDSALFKLEFSDGDFDLLIDTVDANEKDYLDGYNGEYGLIFGDYAWWNDSFNFEGEWIWPTLSTRVTSGYYKRSDPFTGEISMHSGIDVGRPIINGVYDNRPQPIFAVADGIVIKSGKNGGYGNSVSINHGNGIVSLYGHLKSIDKNIEKNVDVTAGTVIGIMGTTGRSTAIHLHFSVLNDSQYDNPLKYIKMPAN